MDDLKPLLDMLSGAGGVGLIAYGILSKIKKEWDDTKALLSEALNKISAVEQDRIKCRPAHDKAIMEIEDDLKAHGERIAKLEAIQALSTNSHTQSTIIPRQEAVTWNNKL